MCGGTYKVDILNIDGAHGYYLEGNEERSVGEERSRAFNTLLSNLPCKNEGCFHTKGLMICLCLPCKNITSKKRR